MTKWQRPSKAAPPIVLLMTASIDPRGCFGSMFSAAERRQQYLHAFAFYLRELDRGTSFNQIVFCENSGADLSEFRALVPTKQKGNVEFCEFAPALFDGAKGKSYNEALLIDRVLSTSRLLADEDTFFFKVTGRYAILNIRHFIRACRKRLPDLDFYGDVKDHTLWSSLGLPWREQWCDFRHIGFSVRFWKQYVEGHYTELDDTQWRVVELWMFELSRRIRNHPKAAFRFSQEIFMDGLNGNRVSLLNIPLSQRAYTYYVNLRGAAGTVWRWVFPWIWI
jgi:hypothetical protein